MRMPALQGWAPQLSGEGRDPVGPGVAEDGPRAGCWGAGGVEEKTQALIVMGALCVCFGPEKARQAQPFSLRPGPGAHLVWGLPGGAGRSPPPSHSGSVHGRTRASNETFLPPAPLLEGFSVHLLALKVQVK